MRAVRKAVAVGWTRCPSVGVPLHVQLRWHYLRSAPLFIAEFYSLNPCLLSANLPTVLLATMAQSPTNIGAPATAVVTGSFLSAVQQLLTASTQVAVD